MSSDTRYSKSSGNCCAVIGCKNNEKKRFIWESKQCTKHNGKTRMFCKCPRPFRMFKFPNDKTEVSNMCRMTWLHNLKRKNFKPGKNSSVCSDHFVEGKPTNKYPYPELLLGHSEKITKSRSTKTTLDLNMSYSSQPTPDPDPKNDVAENVEIPSTPEISTTGTDDVTQVNRESRSTQIVIVLPCVPNRRTPDVFSEHNYFRTTKSVCDQATQTSPSDFLTENNVTFYTGLGSISMFMTLVNVLRQFIPDKKFQDVSLQNQILLMLMRLRLGLLYQDLGDRFKIDKNMASRITNFWIKTISSKLGIMLAYIPASIVYKSIPRKIKGRYPKLRCIIDCFEIFTERPLKLSTRAQMYSNYKSHQTAKYLLGVAPHGLTTFLSSGFSGRTSDLNIVRNSGFLNLIEPNDQIMADRGFNISEDISRRGGKLLIPTFTRGKKQLTAFEVLKTRRIANSRIHVERAIARIKSFRILNGNIPISQMHILDDVMRVICILCNLKKPLIKDN